MATATCRTVAGVFSGSNPTRVGTGFCATKAGVASATARVQWGGSDASRDQVSWLPPANVPIVDANGRVSQAWYKFFVEIATRRLGGIDGQTIPQVVGTQGSVQDQVLSVQQSVQSVGSQVAAVTDVVNTQTEVSKASNLSGSGQLSKLPGYKLTQLGLDDV
jgi:hypothetical protein